MIFRIHYIQNGLSFEQEVSDYTANSTLKSYDCIYCIYM